MAFRIKNHVPGCITVLCQVFICATDGLILWYLLGNSQVIDQGHIYVTPIKPRQGHGVVVWTAIGGNGA